MEFVLGADNLIRLSNLIGGSTGGSTYIAVPKVSSDFAIDEDLQLHVARIVEDICGYSNCFPGIISQIWDNIRANKSTVFSHGIILRPGLNIYY